MGMSRPWIAAPAGQAALLPLDPADSLPADHLVWDMLGLVDELDLSAFEAAYRADGRGRPPYDPKMMLTLILYCQAKGVVTSQPIAAACVNDLGAMVICGGLRPDRSAIAAFIKRH